MFEIYACPNTDCWVWEYLAGSHHGTACPSCNETGEHVGQTSGKN